MPVAARTQLIASLALLLASSASAGPGAIEINQATALAGIDAGDTAGFPVTITNAGSYRLVGTLTVPDSDTSAIVVSVDGVKIDLNGFAIVGPNTCSWSSPNLTCTDSGTGIGIDARNQELVQVRNGTIRGMGSDSIYLGVAGSVERVFIVDGGNYGIRSGARSQARLNRIIRVDNYGIQGDGENLFRDNIVDDARGGIGVNGAQGIISGNITRDTELWGIYHQSRYGVIRGNVVYGTNGAIFCDDECVLERNAAVQGRAGGFQVDNENVVRENMIYNNITNGLAMGLDGIVIRNIVHSNSSVNLSVDSSSGDRTGFGGNVFRTIGGATCLTGGAKLAGVFAVSNNVCNGFVGCVCTP